MGSERGGVVEQSFRGGGSTILKRLLSGAKKVLGLEGILALIKDGRKQWKIPIGTAARSCTWDEKLARNGSFQVTLAATKPGVETLAAW